MAHEHLVGCILGTAVGDAIGLPYEGLSSSRGAKLFGPPDRHRFLFGRGMVSDDTELTCITAQALIASGGNVSLFRRELARRLRFWLLGVPAGVGWATLRAVIRLWLGFSPANSGVFSAGNGPAMRAAVLGAAIDDRPTLRELVRVSSRMTHTDPQAEYGALTIALAAKLAGARDVVPADEFAVQLKLFFAGAGDDFALLILKASQAAKNGLTTKAFASSLGCNNRVSGYVAHSVPVVIHAWLTHQRDFRSAVTAIIECGGDTDSTAAMLGGIIGTSVGKQGIPQPWLSGLMEWPRSVQWLEDLANQLGASVKSGSKHRPPKLPIYVLIPRNVFFLLIVLYHGFRRLLPPY